MDKQDAKIEFLHRMNRRNGLYADLALFFLKENVINNIEVSRIMSKAEDARATEFYIIIKNSVDKFHLIDWEWVMLPVETMRLTFVTHNGVKEFTWSD